MRWKAAAAFVLASGLAGVPLLAGPGHAAVPPTYTCDDFMINSYGRALATDDCVASTGAPATGPIYGHFYIKSRKPQASYHCFKIRSQPSGFVDMPRAVAGYMCEKQITR